MISKNDTISLMIIETKSAKETQELAGKILAQASDLPSSSAKVIAFEGELGAGKTTLIQAIAKALGVETQVKSPTFVLMKRYEIKGGSLYHLDCYRLVDESDLEPLGLTDILANPGNIVLIEWSERVQKILPEKRLTVHIDHIDKDVRKIEIK